MCTIIYIYYIGYHIIKNHHKICIIEHMGMKMSYHVELSLPALVRNC